MLKKAHWVRYSVWRREPSAPLKRRTYDEAEKSPWEHNDDTIRGQKKACAPKLIDFIQFCVSGAKLSPRGAWSHTVRPRRKSEA